jgi:hypothetical protein
MWCWWCCHDFKGTALSMPYKYYERLDKFTTAGTFCSWSCMKSYALDKYGINRGSIICGNMIMMRKKLFGKLGSIKPAPKRVRLVEFGGDLTIEQFRENVLVDDTPPESINAEPVPNIVVPITSNTAKMYEIKNASGANEPLRLKREKPLKRDQNNLESVLGLVIKKNNNCCT